MSEYSDVVTRKEIVKVGAILRRFNELYGKFDSYKGLYGGIDKDSNDYSSEQFTNKHQVMCAKEIIKELLKGSAQGYDVKRVEISNEIMYFTDILSSFEELVYGSVEGDTNLDDDVGNLIRLYANYELSEFVPINIKYKWQKVEVSDKLSTLIKMTNYSLGSGVFHLSGDSSPYIANYELGIQFEEEKVITSIVAAVIDALGVNIKEVYFIFNENDRALNAAKRVNDDGELTVTLWTN